MKKLIVLATLVFGSLVGVSAQQVDRDGRIVPPRVQTPIERQIDRYNREVQRENRQWQRERDRDRRGWGEQLIMRTEYRYLQVGRRIYRETYRSAYRRNGALVNRTLLNRVRIDDRDRHYRTHRGRSGFGFNIYLSF